MEATGETPGRKDLKASNSLLSDTKSFSTSTSLLPVTQRRRLSKQCISCQTVRSYLLYSVTSTMPSKFTELLDDSYRTTSPESDVRLEDIISTANFDMTRGRTSSDVSSGTNSSSENLSSTISNESSKKVKRMSRLFGKRWVHYAPSKSRKMRPWMNELLEIPHTDDSTVEMSRSRVTMHHVR